MSIGGSAETTRKDSTTQNDKTTNVSGTSTDQLVVDQAGIDKLVQDILSSNQGLSEIFAGEQSSGLYNSTTAASMAGDLAAKVAGEIAKLTGKRTIAEDKNILEYGKETTRGTDTKIGVNAQTPK
jgi:isocitrate dehydrogenase